MNIVDHVQFKEGLPFYDMVTSFMVSLAASPAIFNSDNPMGLTQDQYISVQGILVQGRHFIPYDVYQLAKNNQISYATYLKTCSCMLANTAYDSVKNKDDKSPEFEFFRHIRNASSHNNTFNFFSHEPARPASWRGTEIDTSNNGTSNPLYSTECHGTFIGLADMIDLLKDIEAKFIIPPRTLCVGRRQNNKPRSLRRRRHDPAGTLCARHRPFHIGRGKVASSLTMYYSQYDR